jgi:release factor glutamine methyltransferase
MGTLFFTGVDYDQSVIDVAEKNARSLGVKINALKLNVLKEPIPATGFDVVVSNPPYVLPSEKKQMKNNVLNFEPGSALFVPQDTPLIFYERITEHASNILNNNGMLFYEINESHGNEIRQLLEEKGFSSVAVKQDIHGKDRFVFGTLRKVI